MEGEGRGMGMGGRKWSVGLKSLRMIPPERGEQNDLFPGQLMLARMLRRSLAKPLKDLTFKDPSYRGRILEFEKDACPLPHVAPPCVCVCVPVVHRVPPGLVLVKNFHWRTSRDQRGATVRHTVI